MSTWQKYYFTSPYSARTIVCAAHRQMVDKLLEKNMHEVMRNNDQLAWNMSNKLVMHGFVGG